MMESAKIYILDDDHFYGNLILNSLNKQFNDVAYFDDEVECLSSLVNKPNIIIIDHTLKQSTGIEFIQEVKRKLGDRTAIIYISAQEYVHITLKALQEGALEYIEKSDSALDNINKSIHKIYRLSNGYTTPINPEKYYLSK